jgi:hypothetical protein
MTKAGHKWFSNVTPDSPRNGKGSRPEGAIRVMHPADPITVIAITSSEQDRQLLGTIGRVNGWKVFSASFWTEVLRMTEHDWAGVLLLDQELVGIARAVLLPRPQRCRVILMTPRTKDDPLCAEFINWGVYRILQTPLREREVVHAVRFAWAFWKTCVLPRLKISKAST